MPKKEQSRDHKPPELTKTGSAGYGVNKEYGIAKAGGRPSRADARRLEQLKKQQAIDDALANAEKARAAAAAVRPARGAPGERGDGVFHISFIQMGQGDCTIMCTPLGQVVMIDCGTNDPDGEAKAAFDKRVIDELEDPAYLRNHKTIDVVILSHPDKDHYNRFTRVLPDGYTALTVYHSGEIGHYGSGARWAYAHVLDPALIKQVVLNKDPVRGANTLAGRPIPAVVPGTDKREHLDADGGLIVVAEPQCTITLLASGVAHPYVQDNDTELRNRGSIVTLVEVLQRKILISADATRATEAFLLGDAGRAARLTNVDIVQAGHHGSDVTSSGQNWVDHLKATVRVVISAGEVGVPGHHLPSAAVLKRYVRRFRTDGRAPDATPHDVAAWDLGIKADGPNAYSVDQPVYSTGSNGTQIVTIS